MTRPKSDFDALRQDLHQVYDGDPWHGSSITAVLEGISAEVAWKRSIPRGHTRDDLAAAQKELERAVEVLKPEDLLRWIGDQRDPALGTGLTVGTVIRGLLQHHTYHEGQIALLKRGAEHTT